MQSNDIWTIISNFFASLFSKRPAEDKINIEQAKVELAVEKAEAEAQVDSIKKEEKEIAKIERKIENKNKAYPVTKLKPGKSTIRVAVSGSRKKARVVFGKYDDNFIYDQNGNKYPYGKVYSWQGNLVAKESDGVISKK